MVQLDMLRMRESDPMKQVDAIPRITRSGSTASIRIEAIAYQSGLLRLVKNTGAAQGIYPPIKPYKPAQSKRPCAIVHAALFSGGMVHPGEKTTHYTRLLRRVVEFPARRSRRYVR